MNHYKQRDKESIEIIRYSLTDDEFRGFLLGNVYKYLNRYQYKGSPVDDIAKAIHYLQALEYMLYKPDTDNPFEDMRRREILVEMMNEDYES